MSIDLPAIAAALALLVGGAVLLRETALQAGGVRLAACFAAPPRKRIAVLALGALAGAAVPADRLLARVLPPPAQRTPAPALLLLALLGAELGGSLAVLALIAAGPRSFEWLTLAGMVLALGFGQRRAGSAGRALLAAAMTVLALALLQAAAAPLAAAAPAQAIAAALAADPLLAATLGAGAAVLLRSTHAPVLLLAVLAAEGVLAIAPALAILLGANLGGAALVLRAATVAAPRARQAAAGHLVVKALATATCLAVLAGGVGQLVTAGRDAALMVAAAHLSFNLAVALTCGAVAGAVVRAMARCWPARPQAALRRLDPAALPPTPVALACAARELARLADLVESMLGGLQQVLRRHDAAMARAVRQMDDAVDQCYWDAKHYLAALRRQPLDTDAQRRWGELMDFAIALEQVADTVERVLRDLEARAPDNRDRLPPAAAAEAAALHAMLMRNVRLAVSLLLQRDPGLARVLQDADARFARRTRECADAHLRRLAEGQTGSVAASAVYLDVLGDLERMNTLVCAQGEGFLRRQEGDASPAAWAPARA